MPTIKQLPAATAVSGTDLIPLSQNGLTRGVAVNTLLSNTQPLLSLVQSTLLGRVSVGLGGPEAIGVGNGLALQSGAIVATAYDHLTLAASPGLLGDDEIIVNSMAAPKRLSAVKLRALFTAGSGVQIDGNGVISATSSASGGSGSTGPSGPKGDTGAQGPAGQGFTFRGPWQPNVAYAAYDVVTSGGQTYVASAPVVAAASFSAVSWSLMAAQGAVGPAGATGAAGPTIPATATSLGAVKSGSGLSISADGTLSISNVALGSIGQGGASVGQLLGWSGSTWSPTTPAAGVTYTGTAPIAVASGVISLSQANAVAGQVLTWSGSAWQPQNAAPSGAAVGTALPLSNGVAASGTAATASREDHRHPTDVSRAPIAGPVFTGSITLPIWTSTTRPTAPTAGMEGYSSDTSRRETFTPAGWVQYVRTTDVSAASGQLLGGTGTAGATAAVSIGSGLSLTSGVLSATASPVTSLAGVSIDGASNPASLASPYQMTTADRVVDVNKSSGAATKILLPQSPTLWVEYTIIDGRGDATMNNIILAAAAGTTINGQATFVMNANNDAIALRAVNATTWRVS